MRRLLDRLRDEKDINVSAWVRRQLRATLEREFPGTETTQPLESDTTPIADWKPWRLPGGTRDAGLEGERVAGLPDDDQLRRTETSILARTSGRPSR